MAVTKAISKNNDSKSRIENNLIIISQVMLSQSIISYTI